MNNSKLNVWLLDPAQLTPYYNVTLADALVQTGCNVRYIASPYLYDTNLSYSDRFKIDYLYFKGLHNPKLIRYPNLRRILRGISYPLGHLQLIRQLRQNRPDILHIQWSRVPHVDYRLVKAARDLGIAVIHTVHDVIPSYAPNASTGPLERVFSLANALILHTQTNRTEFHKQYPTINLERTHVIPLINAHYMATPDNVTQTLAREQLNLPLSVPIFLFFGAIRPYKGVDLLIAAFNEARKTMPELHLMIAGKPDTPEDQAILEIGRRSPNIHVTSGFVPYEAMWQYYIAADIVVLPYRSITQSAALLSAMDFGKPVIVTNVGGLAETLDGNGWVIPPNDIDLLTNVIRDAANNRVQLEKMGHRSLQLIEQNHAPAVVAERTRKLYEQTLAAHQ